MSAHDHKPHGLTSVQHKGPKVSDDELRAIIDHKLGASEFPDFASIATELLALREQTKIRPIEQAEPAMHILVWEPDYGWLLVAKNYVTGKFDIKSSGNAWCQLPDSVEPTCFVELKCFPAFPTPPQERE